MIVPDDAIIEILTLECETCNDGWVSYTNNSGLLHRIHGPALINKNKQHCWWYKDNLFYASIHDGKFYINSKDPAIVSKEKFIKYLTDNGFTFHE